MGLRRTAIGLAVAGVVVLVLGAGYLFALPMLGLAGGDDSSAHGGPAQPGPMYVVKERTVNLADPGGRRYLRISMHIEFIGDLADSERPSGGDHGSRESGFEKSIAPWAPLIEDRIITLLTSRSAADVSTPEGKQQIKNEIRDSLNSLLGGDRVSAVHFTQFLMQ